VPLCEDSQLHAAEHLPEEDRGHLKGGAEAERHLAVPVGHGGHSYV